MICKVSIFWEGNKNISHLPLVIWRYILSILTKYDKKRAIKCKDISLRHLSKMTSHFPFRIFPSKNMNLQMSFSFSNKILSRIVTSTNMSFSFLTRSFLNMHFNSMMSQLEINISVQDFWVKSDPTYKKSFKSRK